MPKIPRDIWEAGQKHLDDMRKLLEERVKTDQRIARERAEREQRQKQAG